MQFQETLVFGPVVGYLFLLGRCQRASILSLQRVVSGYFILVADQMDLGDVLLLSLFVDLVVLKDLLRV